MPTSSRLSRQLLLASILCLTFTVQLTSVAAAQEQEVEASLSRYRDQTFCRHRKSCGIVEWIAPSGKV
jgi:hypothetical protein